MHAIRSVRPIALAGLIALVTRSAGAQCCGDCSGDAAVSVDEIIIAVTRSLQGCADDGICGTPTCTTELGRCQADLATCESQPGRQRFPATGQTTAAGPGSDGAVRAGGPLSYTDHGDGTITDDNTGLMWEKKDNAGGIHDKDNTYTWGGVYLTSEGTMVTEFLTTLNRAPCFAGRCDWRIPNIKELLSLVDFEVRASSRVPAVRSAFHNNCRAGCRLDGRGGPMCSCTVAGNYWSSTTHQGAADWAWRIRFDEGVAGSQQKTSAFGVRAVRGGFVPGRGVDAALERDTVTGTCCGDCNGDGSVTVDEIVTAVNRALSGCADDRICSTARCPEQLRACQSSLTMCRSSVRGQRFPASGQTRPYGPGSDGDVRAGFPLSFTDHGDGTITDDNTGLMWEKKDFSGGLHDKDKSYTWGHPTAMDGTMVTEFLALLNRPPCFAGYCDWRIPNAKELQSLIDYELPAFSGQPAIAAAFSRDCRPGCTVDGRGGPMCSCTAADFHMVDALEYWSSTTVRPDPIRAWSVAFLDSYLGSDTEKSATNIRVRAVRGGL